MNLSIVLEIIPVLSSHTETNVAKNKKKWKHHFSLILFVSFSHPFSSSACQNVSNP
jgi:hypothetical protein